MLFLKKLSFLVIGSSTIVLTGSLMKNWSPFQTMDANILEKIFSMSGNIKNVSLSSKIDGNVSSSKNPFLYSLFSTNMNSFVSSFQSHFSTWSLFKWADGFLRNTNKNSFTNPKIKIFNKFLELKNSYRQDVNSLSSKNWTQDNYLISQSHSDLKNIFDEVFFKEIYIGGDQNNGEKKLGMSDKKKISFGDIKYSENLFKFQDFVFDHWLENEKPSLFCKKDWSYSKSFTSKNYKEGVKKSKSPDYRFPDFNDQKTSIQDFNKKISSGNACSESDFKIFTTSEISNLEDAYEISAFLHRTGDKGKPINSEDLTDSESSTFDSQDPIKLFFEDKSKITKNNEFYSWKAGDIFDTNLTGEKDKHILSFRDFKYENQEDKGYATYVRTKKGLTFLYKDPSKESIKKYLLEKEEKKDSSRKQVLTEILKDYFHSHTSEIFGEYLSRSDLSSDGGIFAIRNWDSALYDLANHISKYSSTLRRNKNHWKILQKLSNSYNDLNDSTKSNESKGLAVPIQLQRNLDNTTALTESSWLNDEENNSNDGDFPSINSLLGKSKKEDLHENFQLIKQDIKKYLNILPIQEKSSSNSSYFLDDYILDNIYHDFKNKEGLMRKTTSNIFLVNSLGIDIFKNDIDSFSSSLSKEIDPRNENELKKLILENIIEVFYGRNYFSETVPDRANYGGYKISSESGESSSKFCRLKIKDRNSSTEKKNEEQTCSNLQENKKQLHQKLLNYWLLKNHFFTGNAYEFSSDETNSYIRFLFSLNWFVKNNFVNYRNFSSSKIPNNRFGVLLWMENVAKVEDSSLSPQPSTLNIGEHNTSGNKNELKNVNAYLSGSNQDDIFSPFLSRKISSFGDETKKSHLSSDKTTAFARVGNNEFMELSGFQGFISEALNARNLPDSISKALFLNFHKSNPHNNKTYSSSVNNSFSEVSIGSGYGFKFSEDPKDFDEFLSSFKTYGSFLRFMEVFLKKEAQELRKSISYATHESGKEYIDYDLPLSEKIKEAKKLISKNSSFEKFKIATTRFSGFLMNPDAEEGIHRDKKYFIQKDVRSIDGHIVYATQVNKYDFGEGFQFFVKTIGIQTLLKTISILSLNETAKVFSSNTFLVEKGVFLPEK